MNFNIAPCGKCVYFDKVCPVSQTCEEYKQYTKLKRMRNEWLKEVKDKNELSRK